MQDPFFKFTWAWRKYYYNSDTYILLPTKADFIDTELLIAAFKGLIIVTNKENSEFTEEDPIPKLIKGKKA